MTTKKPLIILTAGGTGGHVFPAESLAEELSKRGYDLALVTDTRGKDNYQGKLGSIKNYAVYAGALVGKSKWFKIKSLFKTAIGVLQSCCIIIKNKPACVIGFGGYASFPCCVAAIILRKPLFIHEQNSVMSRTNRILAKHATIIAQSFNDVKYTPNNIKTVLTGMPIRKAILDIKDRPYPTDKNFQLLILGGSQGAKIFSEIIPHTLKKFDQETLKNFTIYQQCRKDDEEDLKNAYKDLPAKIIISSFFTNMPEIYEKTNMIISRAGASSVSEVLSIGIPSILVPLPTAADDHQTANASEIATHNAGFVVKQQDFTADKLYSILSDVLQNRKELAIMATQAKSLGITDAAIRFANAVEKELKC